MTESNSSRDTLVQLGKQVVQSILNDDFPRLEIPDRSTGNIIFDPEEGQFVLGSARVLRDSSNVRHVRSFAQLVWVASFAKNLLDSSRTSSLRDLYYSSEAFGVKFVDQAESDRIVADLESLTGISRRLWCLSGRAFIGIWPSDNAVHSARILRTRS